MSRWFMLHNGNKHHKLDEGLYLHYSDTCDVHDVTGISSADPIWAKRATAMGETRLCPSRFGWVAILYETKGVITFFVQLNPQRAAWQRIKWPAGFENNWDDDKVREAINDFLWVAECENARQKLPRLE